MVLGYGSSMGTRLRLLAVTLLVPSLALAQPAPEAAAPVAAGPAPIEEATWSIGAGLSFGGFVGMATSPPLGSSSSPLWSPYYGYETTASIERRLAPRTWLVFGLAGGVNNLSYDPQPAGSGGPLDARKRVLTFTAGARQVAWSRSRFEVSVLGLIGAGWNDSHSRYQQSTGAVTEMSDHAWMVGLSAGLAIEFELTQGLSLRLATPLLRTNWRSGSVSQGGGATSSGHEFQVFAALEPRLELRLAF
jgi:hypothetical protein